MTSDNVIQVLQALSIDIKQYLEEYNEAFLNFQKVNRLVNIIRSLPTSSRQDQQDSGKTKIAIEAKRYQNKKKATQNFIQVLKKGRYLLNYFRMLLTKNSIETYITIKTDSGVYRIAQDKIEDYITPLLSTYGGSTKNNPFSLAYEIDVKMLEQNQILSKENAISNTDIFKEIWNIKVPYLKEYKSWSERKAAQSRVFNSKDAEIYDLMNQLKNQSKLPSNWLTVQKYAELRATMGGGGGYRTSQLKLGDVGLIQDKFVTNKINSVNIIRQQMIEKRLSELLEILNSKDYNFIRKELKRIFTENGEKSTNSLDDISRIVNEQAQQVIDEIFKNLT